MGSFSSLLKGISYKRSKVRTPLAGACCLSGPWACHMGRAAPHKFITVVPTPTSSPRSSVAPGDTSPGLG